MIWLRFQKFNLKFELFISCTNVYIIKSTNLGANKFSSSLTCNRL